ncbi:MAG: hypothetical protein A3G33_05110 [Omnitrophica bacterium RIFCSPLOWO2_12_FULL_44_17]|uniref:DUF1761 domain-containing protein n=1 Tax=Candidatus Danuiimicrobium aquiferis TaxID=1801832 RepID=A0A1G1KXD3_9BACT|nr:MAG: hypothetical protein A3B72_01480 [Omnitrophica bacterium RIFCSPHIGHO2_02_FULL_45_28]OGW89156.1 MAG: hypothetical protein A3E74_06275 [Omnitrophica bacterium RIFCSPHIGHO2_12_FULL_44_12]OGW97535.1 MAG: hypothetical protein A3G33_05110 [Omnitrophica bacterium RIFCSPLOWO2_12_FULL_44_17]OGX02088.1 MAG: hypothetical protein A3J12_06405 [Omnitrophica bacterium RIFCSPLOWO2_02_FULL_44_11]
MNAKRFVMASVAGFVVLFGLDFLIHSVGLAGLYQQTAHLWRPMAEMNRLAWLMWLSYLIMVPILVYIYSKGYGSGKPGLGQGLRFGFWMGLLQSAPMALCCYVVMPVPVSLACGWFIGGMIEMLAVGAVIGLIWKN